MAGPRSPRTLHDFCEIARGSSADRRPAPGNSRSMTNLGTMDLLVEDRLGAPARPARRAPGAIRIYRSGGGRTMTGTPKELTDWPDLVGSAPRLGLLADVLAWVR